MPSFAQDWKPVFSADNLKIDSLKINNEDFYKVDFVGTKLFSLSLSKDQKSEYEKLCNLSNQKAKPLLLQNENINNVQKVTSLLLIENPYSLELKQNYNKSNLLQNYQLIFKKDKTDEEKLEEKIIYFASLALEELAKTVYEDATGNSLTDVNDPYQRAMKESIISGSITLSFDDIGDFFKKKK